MEDERNWLIKDEWSGDSQHSASVDSFELPGPGKNEHDNKSKGTNQNEHTNQYANDDLNTNQYTNDDLNTNQYIPSSSASTDTSSRENSFNPESIGKSSSEHLEHVPYNKKLSKTDNPFEDPSEDLSNQNPSNGSQDPFSSNRSSGILDESAFVDSYGNGYAHVDFDSRRYTRGRRFKGTRLVYFTSAFVSFFVSLFGYEQGVCSGILTFHTFIGYFHNPTATQIGLVVSILEIGAMVSSLLVARFSEVWGRKRTILCGTLVFIIGGSIQLFCTNLWWFGVGRVILGIGVGVLSTIVPLYQCEILPSEDRGKLVCGEFTGNIVGYALSVWVDYASYFLQTHDAKLVRANISWRLPLFIQVLIAIVLFFGGLFIVELPRWLLDVGEDQKGFNVLSLLYASDRDADKARTEFFMIKNLILTERVTVPRSERTWRNVFVRYPRRVMIACLAMAFAQFNGINIISYYAPMVFQEAGFNDSWALLMTGINLLVYLASTVAPWFLVDRWGRKPILVSGGALMCVALTLVAWIMYLDRLYTPSLVAVLVVVYNAGFGYSWGPIGFLVPPEVYPLAVRLKGVSLLTASNWLANYIVGQLTPVLQESIGWKMYLLPAGSCVVSVILVLVFYPETMGVELEDIDRVFEEFYSIPTVWGRIALLGAKSKGYEGIEMGVYDGDDRIVTPNNERSAL